MRPLVSALALDVLIAASSLANGAVAMHVLRSNGALVSGQRHNSSAIEGAAASRTTTNATPPVVCISICASEEPAWIDALIQNALTFTEPSTLLTLHLDANTTYERERLDAWNTTSRVTLSHERVRVRRFYGSILYGHLLNVRAMPEACEFVVMQASNMLWVRRGMEEVVREERIGGPQPMYAAQRIQRQTAHPFFTDEVMAGRPTVSWSLHEGSFYPIQTIRALDESIAQWMEHTGSTVQDAILDTRKTLEEFWLPTFVANREEPGKVFAPILSYINIENKRGVTADVVEIVRRGEMPPGYTRGFGPHGLFAVKRVVRSVTNNVTQMILAMS
eukprot:TRINITY_DN5177_c3_g1_i1.p1 TRINITY_DN5177_c3_g1~~TRINITY_DN5177_c3_g1_i1.p1  ORF type:complete len:333 (-),score=46.72 TRINITY_DN5177_c3_g1_i1:194-1192(-)